MLEATFIVVVLVEILVPFALGFYLKEKFGAKWKVFFLGVTAFIVSQIIHIPMLLGWQQILKALGVTEVEEPSLLLIAGLTLAVSFMAGLCEEPMRWIAFKLLKQDGEPSRHGLMLGAGHGGVESILVGANVLANTVVMIMMKSGTFPLEQLAPEQVVALQEISEVAWYMPLWGGFERLLAISLHISLAVVVWLGVRDKKPIRLLYAIGFHTLFNFVGVFSLQGLKFPIWAAELLMFVVALGAVYVMVGLIRKNGMMTLYAPEKLDDEEEFSGVFAEQFREAGFAGLVEGGEKEDRPDDPEPGVSDSSETP